MVRAIEPETGTKNEIVVRMSATMVEDTSQKKAFLVEGITVSDKQDSDEILLKVTATIAMVMDLCSRDERGFDSGLMRLMQLAYAAKQVEGTWKLPD